MLKGRREEALGSKLNNTLCSDRNKREVRLAILQFGAKVD
jgi:hypothetical protein